MPDKDLSELDESFANLRLGNNSIVTSASRQNLVSQASTQQEDQEELIEPIRRIMRRNHPESQIIGDLVDHVQTRSPII